MTEVPWLDVLGNYGGTEYKQLCLAFNYGDGGMKSCRNTVSAVSALLFFGIYLLASPTLHNHGLWLAFIAYLLARGVVQTIIFRNKNR